MEMEMVIQSSILWFLSSIVWIHFKIILLNIPR